MFWLDTRILSDEVWVQRKPPTLTTITLYTYIKSQITDLAKQVISCPGCSCGFGCWIVSLIPRNAEHQLKLLLPHSLQSRQIRVGSVFNRETAHQYRLSVIFIQLSSLRIGVEHQNQKSTFEFHGGGVS